MSEVPTNDFEPSTTRRSQVRTMVYPQLTAAEEAYVAKQIAIAEEVWPRDSQVVTFQDTDNRIAYEDDGDSYRY